MNEQQVTDLFRQAGTAVEPDVGRMVEAGIARGARRRRRRVVVGSWAVAAAVVAVTVPTMLMLRGAGSTTPVVGSGDDVRRIAVSADGMGAALVGLLPGSEPRDDAEPFQYQVQRGVVEWHGVQVSVTIDSRAEGIDTSARERCEAAMAAPCAPAPRGGWLAALGTNQYAKGPTKEIYYDVVRLYVPGGYTIEASGERGEAEVVAQGGGSGADPALLRRLVLSDVWLR